MSNRPNPNRTRTASPSKAPRRPFWQSPLTWVAALIVIAGIVTIVVNATGGDDDTDNGASGETAFAELIGEPLPPFATPDAAIGMAAPTLSAQTLDGDRVQLGADGTARVYAFFAHWCPHCQAELPRIAEWLRTHDLPADVEVVAVSTGVDPSADNYPPSAWFAREEWPAPVLLDDESGSLAAGMGLTGFPYWVAVDANGIVVNRVAGEIDDARFASLIEQVTPDAAS